MDEKELPESWVWTTLEDITIVNPGIDTSLLSSSTPVSFVPMAAVDAGTGKMDSSTIRKFEEVKKGYTAFQEGDVLFAKITPCMENGKFAVAQSLSSHIGFGSTEFHVLRSEKSINPYLLYYYFSQEAFKQLARVAMTGSAGQLRVPATFLKDAIYPLAPTNEQNRIVAAIEQQFTRLDNAVASLKSCQKKFPRYRASLLKSAVEGELTKEWRATYPASETGAQLLTRILAERRKRWEDAELAKMREKRITPKDNKWKQGYKEPQGPDTKDLPKLPERWCWATVEQLAATEKYALAIGPFGSNLKVEDYRSEGVPLIFVRNIRSEIFGGPNTKYITFEKARELQAHKVVEGDILITKMGEPPGDACLYPENSPSAIITADCIKWTLSPILPEHIFFVKAINSPIVRNQILHITKGVAQQKVSLQRFSSIAIPLPPLAEQQQIVLEVEAALSNIAKLEEATEHSLKRAEHERQSILREAFVGRLVPQDPQDEPASVLLERIRAERKQREEAEKVVKVGRREVKMEVAKNRRRRKTSDGTPTIGLYEKLVELGQPVPPEELFKAVGLKVDDQPQSTGAYYTEARADVNDQLIAEIRPDNSHVLVEALEPSDEMLARMQAQEEAALAKKAELQKNKLQKPTLWDM